MNKVNIQLKHDEYRFCLQDIEHPDVQSKIRIVRAKTIDGAMKQIRNRFPKDKYKIENYLSPDGTITEVNND